LCLFFFLLFVNYFIDFNMPKMLYSVPMIYFLLNLVIEYISISKMALIAENSWMILATASSCIFSLEIGKVANNIISKNLHKKVYITGMLSSCFCLGFSVPQIFTQMFYKNLSTHTSVEILLTFLSFGIFSFVFVVSYFENKNLPHRHEKSEIVM